MARTLNCRELIEFLAAYLDGELAPAEHAAFENHLSVCPYCVDYLTTYRKTIHLGKRAFAAEAAILEEFPAELVGAILAARSRGWRVRCPGAIPGNRRPGAGIGPGGRRIPCSPVAS